MYDHRGTAECRQWVESGHCLFCKLGPEHSAIRFADAHLDAAANVSLPTQFDRPDVSMVFDVPRTLDPFRDQAGVMLFRVSLRNDQWVDVRM